MDNIRLESINLPRQERLYCGRNAKAKLAIERKGKRADAKHLDIFELSAFILAMGGRRHNENLMSAVSECRS
jgi:hypothetical protein